MMKRIIATALSLLALFSLITPSFAYSLPQPISGKIFTVPSNAAESLTVLARNLRTSGEIYAIRSGNEYLLEIANIPGGYVPGDTIRVMILECVDNSLCVKDVIVEGSPITLDFDLTKDVCPPCPEDTTPYAECDSCCPTTTTLPLSEMCSDAGYILPEDCPECPPCPEPMPLEQLIMLLLAFFGIGSISAGAGYKFVIRKRKTGELETQITQHKHRVSDTGRAYYHSIYRIHKNPKYRHEPGQIEVPEEWL